MTLSKAIPSFVLALALTHAPANADTIWSWSFDRTEIVATRTEHIFLVATLFNSPLSTEPLTEVGGPSFTGDLQKVYDFTFGPTGDSGEYSAQFAGMSVAPGEFFAFVLGILTPIGGAVPIGLHPFCCEAHLTFGSASSIVSQPPTNTFDIRVVPEPSAGLLLGAGLLLALGHRTRVRIARRPSVRFAARSKPDCLSAPREDEGGPRRSPRPRYFGTNGDWAP